MIFAAQSKAPYKLLGLTERFFEGAEPSLDEVPLEELLALLPEGTHDFSGETVDQDHIVGAATLTHAIPAGPTVFAQLVGNSLTISWQAVTAPPVGFQDRPINIVGYQVIVGAFQVTVPATTLSVTASPEFVASLAPGTQLFEVLAIEAVPHGTSCHPKTMQMGSGRLLSLLPPPLDPEPCTLNPVFGAGGNQTITEGSFVKP